MLQYFVSNIAVKIPRKDTFLYNRKNKISFYETLFWLMACNGVLTPPQQKYPPKSVTPPSLQTFYSPSPTGTGNGCCCIIPYMATSNKHMFTFLKLL